MPNRIYQVDAFTGELFKGNPAAVCLLEKPKPDEWMLKLAQEMNLSETAFLLPIEEGFSLRWFTPKVEVHLCGHATLASAHVLFENELVPADQDARFSTRSGELTARHTPDGVELDFPTMIPHFTTPSQALLDALGVKPIAMLAYGNKHLIEVETEAEVFDLQPDFTTLLRFSGRGVSITARSIPTSQYDFVSRYFAPWIGINEDPVTGSAHCALGPYWAAKLGKTELHAYQASPRGGSLEVRVTAKRTYLTGKAVTVFAGKLK